ncbi:biotin transporter BioY [Weissella halotolerans]|uniref:Biotin transporter n=1 Tax=Weissella halotolerans DSM 20190 TaxID=1123500 RepID=A0A0R2FQL0_9LACO|nr:BioY family transporter [Weissella halotolerans]KRN30809.1 biotin permease BioY [Weissella halotolerans DSM 20190]
MKVRTLTLAALFTALISVLAPLSIPLGPVPLTMQTLIIPLVASITTRRIALLATSGYLLIGVAGIPVFAGWSAGLAAILGPTGGYLLAMLIFPVMIGTGLTWSRHWSMMVITNLVAAALQLTLGSLWLIWQTGMPIQQGLMTGLVAFLIPMGIKVTLVVVLAKSLKQVLPLPIGTES